eukprot:c28462_g1_i1 orf=877-2421(+)
MDGQLGHSSNQDSVPHSIIDLDKDEPVIQSTGLVAKEIAIHENRTEEDSKKRCKLPRFVEIEAGGMMSSAIDQSGNLWMWGQSPVCSDNGNDNSYSLSITEGPQPVLFLKGMPVLKVACGNEHVIAVVDRGSCIEGRGELICYAWGNNKYGQLGLGDVVSRLYPEHVKTLDCQLVGNIPHIACGAFHSAVITDWDSYRGRKTGIFEAGKTVDQELEKGCGRRTNMCWTFGLGENGQLGHGTSQSLTLPRLVKGLPEKPELTGIACGLFHTVILTDTGEVWVWGMERGLGLCPGIGPPGTGAGDALSPLQVIGNFSSNDISSGQRKIACGAAHTVVASEGSKLYSWGRGQSGVLGTGQMADSLLPSEVVWPLPCSGDQMGQACEDRYVRDDLLSKSSKEIQLMKQIDGADNSLGVGEMNTKLSLAEAEISSLKLELSAAKHYNGILHSALYGQKDCVKGNQELMALQEWEKTIDKASDSELVCFEAFYRKMHSQVKEVILKRKVEELCRQYMKAL